MGETWITLLIFVSTSLLTLSLGMLAYDWLFRYHDQVRNRIRDISGESSKETVSLFKDVARFQQLDGQDASLRDRLLANLEQAGIHCSLRRFFLAAATFGLVCGSLGLCLNRWTALPCTAAGVAAAFLAVHLRRRHRQHLLSRQLPEAFAVIGRAIRAGQTLPSALQIIAEDFEAPISVEFARCYEQQNLGISRESSLRQLAKRTGIMELQIFVVALIVQSNSGGDLVELLNNLSAMVRKRLKLKDRVRALTGEGRMQAAVLTLLPVVAFLVLILDFPEYGADLLERPWLLAATAAAEVVGILWVRRIINFEY